MTTATLDVADLNQILEDVFSSFVGTVRPGPGETALDDSPTWIEAFVAISGTWHGEVVLSVLGSSAEEFALAMLGAESGDITLEDRADALCELVNMIGGQVKGTLSPGCRLGLPLLRMRQRGQAVAATTDLYLTSRVWEGHPLRVAVRAV